MTTHRDIIDSVLVVFDDVAARTVGLELMMQLAELVQQLTIIKSQTIMSVAQVVFPISTPMRDFRTEITDYYQFRQIRRTDGKSLDCNSLDMVLVFPSLFGLSGEVTEYFRAGNNIIGVRKIPTGSTTTNVFYVPYISVTNIDQSIVLRDEYREALRILMLAFLFLRVSRFELAKQQLERWAQEVDNANRRDIFR